MKIGRVIVKLKLTNHSDSVLKLHKVRKRVPRQLEVDALVDTELMGLYLQPAIVKKLGLLPVLKGPAGATKPPGQIDVYEPVSIELMGRCEIFQVMQNPHRSMNTIGRLPLMLLDFVVDPKSQKLIGNPKHGGVRMTEEY
jgi:hypothetical protein